MNSRWEAMVREVTGVTSHCVGTLGPKGPAVSSKLPVAARVEIVNDGEGFFLIRFDAAGQFGGDTWHSSLQDAKEQARFEFRIAESDWIGGEAGSDLVLRVLSDRN